MMYYNDNDPHIILWAQNLIDAGYVPPGVMDPRSIQEVRPRDLAGYSHCHFFCGILGWPYAMQLAGWPATRSLWTASCPCQPFSSAGKGGGVADDRHLWPALFRLIRECRPVCVVGEQVASAIGYGWLDGISADLEAEGYAVGAVVLGAHSVGAPHIRQRLYWAASDGTPNRLVQSHGPGCQPGSPTPASSRYGDSAQSAGCWSDYTLIPCRDGKIRRLEPGLLPLVDGASFRLADGRTREGVSRTAVLRGIGNAIVPQVAAAFLAAVLEAP